PAIIPRSPSVRLLGVVTLALTIAGCSALRDTPAPAGEAARKTAIVPETASRTQARAQLAAALRAQAGGDTAAALELYAAIDAEDLPAQARGEYLLGHADAALQEGEILLARDLLTAPAATALGRTFTGDRRRHWLRLRGELFGLLGETAESLSA